MITDDLNWISDLLLACVLLDVEFDTFKLENTRGEGNVLCRNKSVRAPICVCVYIHTCIEYIIYKWLINTKLLTQWRILDVLQTVYRC